MKRWLPLVIAIAGCKSSDSASTKKAPLPEACGKAKQEGTLAWFADDYRAAMSCAAAKHVPVVVDMWAPWCHTCLAMQSTVFQDPSFAADKDRFVFLSLDTDREVNALPLARLSVSAWPTFYILEPEHEQVLARFVGAASVAQFHTFLDSGARAQAGGAAAVDAHMLGAERALAAKDFAAAGSELDAALQMAPASWPRRSEATYYRLLALTKQGENQRCFDFARAKMNEVGADAIATNFIELGWSCADKVDLVDHDLARKLHDEALVRWRAILDDPKATLSIDDRGEAMGFLRDALDDMGKKDDAHKVAEQARALLDDAAAKAPTPMAAMTYNWPRADVYTYLGKPLELVPALEKIALALPKEYDPKARIGWLYWKAGNYDEAAKWTDEALAQVYGPRKGRLLGQRADIAAAKGDKPAEKKFREEAVKLYEELPPGQQVPEALAKARSALAGVAPE